jgi:osmotically-inducible protein OsmY
LDSRQLAWSPEADEAIRSAILAELDRQAWAPRQWIDVVVRNGVVELWGTVINCEQRDAVRVAAEDHTGCQGREMPHRLGRADVRHGFR